MGKFGRIGWQKAATGFCLRRATWHRCLKQISVAIVKKAVESNATWHRCLKQATSGFCLKRFAFGFCLKPVLSDFCTNQNPADSDLKSVGFDLHSKPTYGGCYMKQMLSGLRLRGMAMICLAVIALNLQAQQMADRVCKSDYRIDSTRVQELSFELDNISFFKDNEFAGSMMKGYSLPGLWLQPKFTYQPLKNIRLELGAHALIYSGAYKYPVYAYHDIATWKGNQYQKGFHILPFFRAQFSLRNVNLILGNIYGGSNHGLMDPLFNPELNLTADPEMGFQALYDIPHFHLDAWLNWQSYIFDLDTHQEAFTVGLAMQVKYNNPASRLHFYTPIQLTIQHRGGEQDITDTGAQSLTNAGLGVGMQWNARRKVFTRMNVEVDAVASYQMSGNLWPFEKGLGGFASASVSLWDQMNVKVGYFAGKNFISLFGIPYYSTLSLRNQGARYDGIQSLYGSVEYSRVFAKHYVLGAKVDGYYVMPGNMTNATGAIEPHTDGLNFSFGVYFRVNPHFLIKKFKEHTR